jgi:molecular chaperone DnaK
MVKDAEENAETDKKRREVVDVKNQADGTLHAAEKTLAEFGDKIAAEEKAAIEGDLEALKSAMEGDDVDAIKSKMEALQQSSMKLGEAMYKAQQEAGDAATPDGEAGEAQAGAGGEAKSDDVVDADFEEVDDQDRNKSA